VDHGNGVSLFLSFLDKIKKIYGITISMRVKRNKVYVGKIVQNDEGFTKIPPAERVSIVWELTAEIWSLRKSPYVKRRLQRNVTNLIKNKQSTGKDKDRLDAEYLGRNKED